MQVWDLGRLRFAVAHVLCLAADHDHTLDERRTQRIWVDAQVVRRECEPRLSVGADSRAFAWYAHGATASVGTGWCGRSDGVSGHWMVWEKRARVWLPRHQ
jgi:hypothetical protein